MTGGMNNDLAVRLNVETGEFTEYLLPFETNIRHVDVQITDNPYNLDLGGRSNQRQNHPCRTNSALISICRSGRCFRVNLAISVA